MNDLRTLTAQPRPLVVDGETYMVHPLDMNGWGAIQAWLDAQRPDPFDIVKKAIDKGGFTVAQQQYMIKEAIDKAMEPKPLLGSVEADAILLSIPGYTQVLYQSIHKGRPDFTEADAAELAAKLTATDFANVNMSTNLDLMATDPKAESPSPEARTTGSAASRKRRRKAGRTGG